MLYKENCKLLFTFKREKITGIIQHGYGFIILLSETYLQKRHNCDATEQDVIIYKPQGAFCVKMTKYNGKSLKIANKGCTLLAFVLKLYKNYKGERYETV